MPPSSGLTASGVSLRNLNGHRGGHARRPRRRTTGTPARGSGRMTAAAPPITWWQDDLQRLHTECGAEHGGARSPVGRRRSGRHGEVPLWPFDRPQPPGLLSLVGDRPLDVEVLCRPAHPMLVPFVFPYSVELPIHALGDADWHLLPNGALCLFRGAAWWDPERLGRQPCTEDQRLVHRIPPHDGRTPAPDARPGHRSR